MLGIKSLPLSQHGAGNIFMVLGDPSTPDYLAQHQRILDDTLAAWNSQRVPVDGDEDCIFHSLATKLLHLASNSDFHALAVLKDGSIEIDSWCHTSGKL